MADEVKDGSCFCYAVIGNIPPFYHSSDLRNYFSQFLESGGFECFHFRHRPEIQKEKNKDKYSEKKLTETQSKNEIADTNSAQTSFDLTQFCKVGTSKISVNTTASRNTMCCVVKLTLTNRQKLLSMYHRKHWLNRKGESIRSLCRIDPVQVPDKDTIADKFKTRHESKTIASDRETFTQADLDGLIELKPPDIMPHGNVGTPTKIFLDLINKCLLPPIVIKKLGLTFPKTRTNKRYGNVPFDYGGDVEDASQNDTIEEDVKTAQGHLITGENEKKEQDRLLSHMSKREREKLEKDEMKKLKAKNIEEDMIPECNSSGEDDDTCEEWERHEALHDDPSNAERNKERLFEEKIELKWEKGGSGLVFYTDAQYWAKEGGDFDEQTADDWDVDMSVYYDPTGGDKDARDHVTMRREKRRREGLQDDDESVGKFEQFTKGVGRKVLEKQGWREGTGLGGSRIGISSALEGEGQKPRDKSGLGYHGEKLSRNVKKKRAERDVIISTSYDEPRDNDPLEPLLRRSEPYTLKYRDSVLFNKSTDPT